MTVELSAPGIGTLELDDCDAGYLVQSLDIGSPDVRDVVSSRPLSDGTIDRTRFAGSRAVTLDLAIVERPPLYTPARYEPRESLRLDGHGFANSVAPFTFYSPTIDLRYELALDDYTNGLQVLSAQYAPGEASWIWALDALGQPVLLVSTDGIYFHAPGTNLLPNPTLATNATGYENVFHASTQPFNLLSEQQASIETGSTTPANPNVGYVPWGVPQVHARSTTQARHGASSVALTRSDGTKGPAQIAPLNTRVPGFSSTAWPGMVPVEAGKTYTWMGTGRGGPTGDYDVWALGRAYYYDQNNAEMGQPLNTANSATGARAGWVDHRLVFTVPASLTTVKAASLNATFYIGAGETAYADRLGFFEGDVPSSAWEPPRDAATMPVNLLNEVYQSCESSTTTWFPANATATIDTTRADHGLRSTRVTQTGAALASAFASTPVGTYTTGEPLTAMASAWFARAANVRILIQPLTSGGGALSYINSPVVAAKAGWNRLTFSFTSPDTAAQFRVYVQPQDLTANEQFNIDRGGLFRGANLVSSEWTMSLCRSEDPTAPEGTHVLLLTRERGPGHVEVRTTPVAATPGKAYGTSVLTNAPAGRNVTTYVECLNAAGAVLASVEQTDTALGTWMTSWAGSVLAPALTTQVRLRVKGLDFAEGEYMRLDYFELVDMTYGSVTALDGQRTVLRQEIGASTTSAYSAPSNDGPWTAIYENRAHAAIAPSDATLSIGAINAQGVPMFGATGNVYASWFVDGENDLVVASWDGYTLANATSFDPSVVLGGDAMFVDEPPMLLEPERTEFFDTRRELFDRLAPFLHPGVVSTLTYATDPLAEPRRVRVRASDWSAPWENPSHLSSSLGFVTVGQPWALGPEQEVRLSPGTMSQQGRAYALTFNRSHPAGTGVSALQVTNKGNAPAEWTAIVYGPINGFELINTTLDERLRFPTLNIPAGQSVVIDSTSRTVLADGDPASSRYGYIDFASSSWFRLVPGVNLLRVLSATFSAPSQTLIRFADTYIL